MSEREADGERETENMSRRAWKREGGVSCRAQFGARYCSGMQPSYPSPPKQLPMFTLHAWRHHRGGSIHLFSIQGILIEQELLKCSFCKGLGDSLNYTVNLYCNCSTMDLRTSTISLNQSNQRVL